MTKSLTKPYIGIGGWTYEPWRGVFYPKGLAQAKELTYAASQLTSIEINGTYYGSQKPESFRKWARETPDGFIFSVKGPRFAVNRSVLSEAGDSIKRFYDSGLLEPGRTRTATVECIESVETLAISYDSVMELYFQNPTFGFYLLQLSTARLFHTIRSLEEENAALRVANAKLSADSPA